jgi:hypothetical protein
MPPSKFSGAGTLVLVGATTTPLAFFISDIAERFVCITVKDRPVDSAKTVAGKSERPSTITNKIERIFLCRNRGTLPLSLLWKLLIIKTSLSILK